MTTYHARATKIVDRLLPALPEERTPHGFYERFDFIDKARRHAQHNDQRKRLYHRTFARLRAKVEGGKPYIKLPAGSAHLFGPGDPIFDIAKQLEQENAA